MNSPQGRTDLRKRSFLRTRLTEEQEVAVREVAKALGMTISQVIHDGCLLWLGSVYAEAAAVTWRGGKAVARKRPSRITGRPIEIHGLVSVAQGEAVREAAEAVGITLQQAAFEAVMLWLRTVYGGAKDWKSPRGGT